MGAPEIDEKPPVDPDLGRQLSCVVHRVDRQARFDAAVRRHVDRRVDREGLGVARGVVLGRRERSLRGQRDLTLGEERNPGLQLRLGSDLEALGERGGERRGGGAALPEDRRVHDRRLVRERGGREDLGRALQSLYVDRRVVGDVARKGERYLAGPEHAEIVAEASGRRIREDAGKVIYERVVEIENGGHEFLLLSVSCVDTGLLSRSVKTPWLFGPLVRSRLASRLSQE